MKKITLMLGVAVSSLLALETDKISLKANMNVSYKLLPKQVDSLGDIFDEGTVYGRFRMNSFAWDWEEESTNNKDNGAVGIGGSLIYKTAQYKGLSSTVGFYTTQTPGFLTIDIDATRAGKDVYNRSKVRDRGDYGLNTVGQALIEYNFAKSSIKAGRQLVESPFTASNDTKMIPNTFDGVTVEIDDIQDTHVQLGYLLKQKLRDHEDHHDLLASDGWNENDDAAINKSLTKDLIGVHNHLAFASIANTSIKNLKWELSNAYVQNVINQVALEAHYGLSIGGGAKLIPGFRVMMQTDLLHTDRNVSNLSNKHSGYKKPNELNGALYAARVDYRQGALLVRYGYSYVTDQADIIAPWRSFPTGGFTRAMAQYNWYANTESQMLELNYAFTEKSALSGYKLLTRYAIQNTDNTKVGVPADSNVVHIDVTKGISKNSELKLRMAFVESHPTDLKPENLSYNEYRLELNNFF